eukprot:6761277-Heterocapsa_arctica.AAC.1
MAEYKCNAVEALKTQCEENRRVNALSRAGYEHKIMNMNVVHQQENTLCLSEVARLSDRSGATLL